MVHLTKNISMDTSCHALLSRSLRLYQEVETLYQSMPKDLSAPAVPKVMRLVGTMDALLQEAQTLDTYIAEDLKTQSTISKDTEALLEERDKTLERIYQNNQIIAKSAENVKSLLRHEISSLSTSHHAIKGYKPAGEERQYIVRESF